MTFLRPWHSTRYYPVPVAAFSSLMMILLPLLSAALAGITAMIPFAHPSRTPGMFSIGDFAELYFVVAAFHFARLWRRMVHMHLETHSMVPGPPLPIFHLVPWMDTPTKIGIWLEPAFILICATILQDLLIIQPGLALFFRISAGALAMTNFVRWFRDWEQRRDLVDLAYAAPILADLTENKATDEQLASINLASFPDDLPENIRSQAAAGIVRNYSQR
jgi:hypothetical protein